MCSRRLLADRVVAHRESALPATERCDPLDPLTPVLGAAGPRRGREAEVPEQLRLLGQVLSAAMLVGSQPELSTVAQRLRPRARAVRRADRFVPGDQAHAGRHVRPQWSSPGRHLRCRGHRSRNPAAGDPARSASTAKLLAGEAGISNGQPAVQILGGMGFTWDMLPHLFLKRSWVLEHFFGTATAHAARLGAALGEEVLAVDRGVGVTDATDGVLRISLDRPDRKNALDAAGHRARSSTPSSRPRPTTPCGPSCCGAPVATSAPAPTGSPATQPAGPAQAGQHPATHAAAGAPADPAPRSRCSSRSSARCGGGPPGSGARSRWPPTSRSPPSTSRFWEPFLRRGFSPDSGATWLLPRLVGVARAKELLLLGRDSPARRRPSGA